MFHLSTTVSTTAPASEMKNVARQFHGLVDTAGILVLIGLLAGL